MLTIKPQCSFWQQTWIQSSYGDSDIPGSFRF